MAPVQSPTGNSPAAAGFTLLELLVVLAVACLLAVALPTVLQTAMPRVSIQAAADTLADDLKLSRASAVLSGVEVDVIFDVSAGRYSFGPEGRTRRLSDGISFRICCGEAISRESRLTIHFFPDGSTSGGKVSLSSGVTTERVVRVDELTGRVSLDD